MGFNPGDVYQFVLNIPDTGFTISSTPTITILPLDGVFTPVVTAANMAFVTGSDYIYVYSFTVPSGSPADYVSLVSYATSTPTTVSNQFLDRLHIGDSYVAGPVALNSTVAKDATVAKNATVLLASQYVAPGSDPTVQTININVQDILAGNTTLVAAVGTLSESSLSGLIQDIYDATYGSIVIDQTQNPPVLTIKRINGTIVANFLLINNNSTTARNFNSDIDLSSSI